MKKHSCEGQTISRRQILLGFATTLLTLLLVTTPVVAQTSIAELAAYDGADRMQKLIDGAKQEGTLTIYTSAPVDDMTALTSAFTEKYGVKVEVWRGSSEDVLQRGVAETRAGRYTADILETNGPELEALTRENILQPVSSPTFNQILPSALFEHRSWIGTRLNVITSAYNTNLVQAADVPKTWTDFLNPAFKGKLGIEAEDFDWLAAVVKNFPSEAEGIDFFKKLAATNGLSVRKGHTLLTNLTASGEVPMSMTVYQYKAQQLKQDGAPIEWFGIAPIPARVNGIGVSRHSTHPHAALLFYEFELTDAQSILAKRGFTPTNISLFPLPENLKLSVIDSKIVLDEGKKWRNVFDEVISAKP
ncbi:ABC transporter substrate-binding protein [Candidatus Phyllobacterium onerii]|uniref:ABC transporter substrate-binding protein n=1 Tax=Candidatus Phyllobacterium onerii TaxID=3020828 RepID=UPI00232BB5C0|nr:extracellular solute-binding protein [Phyllobacterium sp. IY22]